MSEGGQGVQNSSSLSKTRDVVAEKSGFGSHDTLAKAEFIADNASEETIKQLNKVCDIACLRGFTY